MRWEREGQTKEKEERREEGTGGGGEGGREGGKERGRERREGGRGGRERREGEEVIMKTLSKVLAGKHCGLRCGTLPMFKSDLFLVRISMSVTKNPHSWEFCRASSKDGEMARERHNT